MIWNMLMKKPEEFGTNIKKVYLGVMKNDESQKQKLVLKAFFWNLTNKRILRECH